MIEYFNLYTDGFRISDGNFYTFLGIILSCLLMSSLHLSFAIINHYRLKNITCESFKKYNASLRNVFLQCATIHIFNMVVFWFWTPFWIIIVLNLFNCFSTLMLIINNNEKYIIEDYYAGMSATKSLNFLKEYIQEHKKEQKVLLSQVSDIITSIKNDIDNA